MKVINENFTSINNLLNVINSRQINAVFEGQSSQSSEDGSYEFTKTNSYTEAAELLLNGYDEVLDEIKRGVNFNYEKKIGMRPKNDINGFIPNVPNALLNLPQSMINIQRIPKKVPVINIIYAVNANCGVESEDYIQAGIKILNIINTIESNGIRVNLKNAFFCATKDDEIVFSTVNIKRDLEPLSLLKICFPLVHPSMLRRIGFRYLETQPEIKSSYWPFGYGRPVYVRSSEYDVIKKHLNKNDIFITLAEMMNKNEEEILHELQISNNWR